MLLPEIERQQEVGKEVVFRADAAFAKPQIYEALEERGVKYAIRLPANDNLLRDIEELLARPVGGPVTNRSCGTRAPTHYARAQVSTLHERFLKLGAQVVVSVRRIVLHLPRSLSDRDSFHSLALSLGATSG